MSRSRNIQPGFFANEDLAQCSTLARLLFIALWCEADREGRLEDRPKRLRAKCLPYDDCDCDALLDELAVGGFIARYSRGDDKYIQVLKFSKYQNPHVKEKVSTIPAPNKPGASPVQDAEVPVPALLIPDSLIPDSNKESAGADAGALLLAVPKPKAKTGAVEIDTWMDDTDGDAIPTDDPIFEWAQKAGIPLDFLELSWNAFIEDMRCKHKRQKDWRAHYRNAVKLNWYKLWWFAPDGECRLNTAGEQARRTLT